MRGLQRLGRDRPATVGLFLSGTVLCVLTACGSGGSSNGTAPEVNVPISPAPTGSVQIQVSPSLSPAFDPNIHDYVVNCTASPEIQFTAWLQGGAYIAFYAPTGATIPSASTAGQFQRTLSLRPGQRFRFTVGQGPYEYSVRCIPSNFPQLSVSATATRAAEWYVFAPTTTLPLNYVIITDDRGTPVWWDTDATGTILDAKVLGTDEIAWNTGTPLVQGGEYYIRNFSGQLLNTLTGRLDEHDLQPTPTGTYLAIRTEPRVCPPDCADMSPWGGSAQSAVIDAEIIEVDSNSNVLWTWRTRDHIALSETGLAGWYPGVGNDIIHMNAVQPDGTDGVLFSARHLNAIFHVTKSTGNIDWKVGGVPRPESLTVIGDTRPSAIGSPGTVLSGQHDVRKWPDGTVSVHDNGTIANRPPYVVRYQIDPIARTAVVVEEFTDPRVLTAGCCGSARRLPSGHWLVQWGAATFLSEYDSTAAPIFSIEYKGAGFSYRATPVLPGVLSGDVLRAGMDAILSR